MKKEQFIKIFLMLLFIFAFIQFIIKKEYLFAGLIMASLLVIGIITFFEKKKVCSLERAGFVVRITLLILLAIECLLIIFAKTRLIAIMSLAVTSILFSLIYGEINSRLYKKTKTMFFIT